VEREIILELKLLADVGLVGFPNVGKSTLLSVVSKARPKIANYHFTTLFPNLGVVYAGEGSSFVMADIPGIIEGASDGAGLGHDFLRHIDRCRLIIHVVDASGIEGRDPIEDFETINRELREYSEELASRPMIVAANKCDIADEETVEKLRKYVEDKGMTFFRISAAAHIGISELVSSVAYRLKELPPIVTYEPEFVEPEPDLGADEPTIEHEDNYWYIDGGWVDRLVENVNFTDYESRMYFDRVLRERGIFDKLEELGVNEGDTVNVCGIEFEYKK
jgi:GTP-binding protein